MPRSKGKHTFIGNPGRKRIPVLWINGILTRWHWISEKKLLFVGRIMSSSQKTAIPLLDSSALANIAMTNSRTPEKFLLFIFYRSITEKALGIAWCRRRSQSLLIIRKLQSGYWKKTQKPSVFMNDVDTVLTAESKSLNLDLLSLRQEWF